MKLPNLSNRVSALRHKSYVRLFCGLAPYYVVNEFPKSGGTWLAQMLADALELPFRRNSPIQFEKCVTHGHFYYPVALQNVVVLWRDPRDVLVSFYFHCYFINEHGNETLVKIMKKNCPFVDYGDIKENLPEFIRFVTECPISPRFSWPDFVQTWADRTGTVQTKYETLREQPNIELGRVLEALTGVVFSEEVLSTVVEKNNFARAKEAAEKNRTSLTESSFVREGSLGGWKKHFSNDALNILDELDYNCCLSSIGYEIMT